MLFNLKGSKIRKTPKDGRYIEIIETDGHIETAQIVRDGFVVLTLDFSKTAHTLTRKSTQALVKELQKLASSRALTPEATLHEDLLDKHHDTLGYAVESIGGRTVVFTVKRRTKTTRTLEFAVRVRNKPEDKWMVLAKGTASPFQARAVKSFIRYAVSAARAVTE